MTGSITMATEHQIVKTPIAQVNANPIQSNSATTCWTTTAMVSRIVETPTARFSVNLR